jgi:hypothetical protein
MKRTPIGFILCASTLMLFTPWWGGHPGSTCFVQNFKLSKNIKSRTSSSMQSLFSPYHLPYYHLSSRSKMSKYIE